MRDESIVVTGLGCVSPFGLGWRQFWDGISNGRCAIRPTRRSFESVEIIRPAATVPSYCAAEHFLPEDEAVLDPFAQFAVLAAREAITDAGITKGLVLPDRVAVVLGTGSSAEFSREQASIRIFHALRTRLLPRTVVKTSVQTAVARITMALGALGPSIGVSTGCAAGTHAVALACLLLRQGLADCIVAGGADAPVVFGTMMAFDALQVLTRDVCRPFSTGRTGMALAEGAGMVVLERADQALARGASIHAEILGVGMSSDAADFVLPAVEGPARAMRLALADARLAPEQISYVNAHGTGTKANDRVEASALREVFGAHALHLAVSSTKSMHGHGLGAAGGFELIATILALREGLLPPTVNYLTADAECDLDFIVEGPRPACVDYALSNSFAFGGLNAVLTVGRPTVRSG